jgi:multicomponent Na+:H+ antiporter subunit G
MSAVEVVSSVLLVTGSALALTAAIGLLRFPDVVTRMHAATKPQTLGLLLVLLGAALRLPGSIDLGMIVLAALFQLITAPLVAQRVGRAAYLEGRAGADRLVVDEWAAARAAQDGTEQDSTAQDDPASTGPAAERQD